MFDRDPQKPLIALGKETPPESFEARVLRELAAINDRLTKLDAALMYQYPRPLSSLEAQLVYASINHVSTVNDPGHSPVILPSRQHEADLPGADFSKMPRYYSLPGPTREEQIAEYRRTFGSKGV